jgi:guanylate kinase
VKPPEVDRIAGSRAAVAARRARAEVKRAVASGLRSATDVVDVANADHPAEASLRVSELIASIAWIGPMRTARIMQELNISPSKRVGGLGVHQRERLRSFLSERQGHPVSGDRSQVQRQGSAAEQRPETALADMNRADLTVTDETGTHIRPSNLVVLAGPTAVGKGTVSSHIRDHHPEVLLSVSATTRAPRPGEVDGVTYYFYDDAEFDRMVSDNEFLEWATVHNAYRYGTPRKPIEKALADGRSVLLEIDIQGARQVREAFPQARLVFLLPPTWDELVRRLTGRGTEDESEQQRRLETAKLELASQDEFDYRVVNSDVATAAQEVVDLMALSEPLTGSGTTTKR